MSHTDVFASLSRFADGLVHPSVAEDPIHAARHKTFISANLIGGVAALALLPLYIALWGRTDVYVVAAFAWIAAQAPVALYLSRTGRFESAHLLLAVAFSALVGTIAGVTGGVGSVFLFWLLLVPGEAALSGSRRVVAVAAAIAAATLATVIGLDAASVLPAPHATGISDWALNVVGLVGGIGYGALIALRAQFYQRHTENMAVLRDNRYRLVAENMSDIVSLHTQDGDVVFITPAVRRVLGLDTRSALGRGFFDHVHVADRPAFLKAISDVIAHRGAQSIEFRASRKGADGGAAGYVWMEMRCQALTEPDPITGAAEILAVTRDISRRKRQEDELKQAREAAEAASHAKTRFLANISHELRTPLNAIIGFSEILSQPEVRENFDADQHVQYAQLIHDSGHHLLQVVNDILDMSKIESGNFEIVAEPFDVGSLIENCRQLIGPAATEKQVSLSSATGENLPELVADRRACKQILLNLLSNAVKFSDPGDEVRIGARREGTRIVLFVHDDGIGIAEADIVKLGNPFFQADSGYDRRHEGTGLGLSVVKGLISLHGGSIDIRSVLGEGTKVEVRLPINCEAAAEPLPARNIAAPRAAIAPPPVEKLSA
ncbi:hypothetical protein CH339_15525 [Rhodobium orientis]|uniref:histidine kinase n=1 Tax=Rhodobium orientis TaxID=34017 RepID=A0A327JMJ5_9HYPH|nr:hypothetical protein [Rhodobium orientis]RAI26072.1 hypothetical protein CH339_15525 [Rhodobium orientis]